MLDSERIIALAKPPVIETPDGKRIEIPVDHRALAELDSVFSSLSAVKQDWLLARFPFSDTDEEATAMLVAKGRELAHSTVKGWKQKDFDFMRAYTLLSGRCVDWAALVAMNIEAGNAVLGALTSRELLLKGWDNISAREITAKMQAAQASIDRFLGRKQEVNVRVVRVEDIVPKR